MRVVEAVLTPALLAAVAAATIGARPPADLYQVELKPPDLLRAYGENHLFVVAGTLGPGMQETRSFVLPRIARMRVLLAGNGVSWSFRAPGGDTIVPGVTGNRPGYEYGRAGDGLAAMALENPEKGTWTVAITSRADTALGFALDIAADGPAEEEAHFELLLAASDPGPSIVARPGDAVFVRTFIARNDTLVRGSRWDLRARTPRDSAIAIPVFDDGAHADGAAGDGVFVGALVAEGNDGIYTLRAEGRTPAGVQYLRSGVIEVHGQSDLRIADSIVVRPRSPRAGEPVTLTVTAMNDGTVEFKNVALELYVDRVKVSEQRVDLKPGESRRIATTWVPREALHHVVQLTLVSYDEPYWSDFTNNTRRATVDVR